MEGQVAEMWCDVDYDDGDDGGDDDYVDDDNDDDDGDAINLEY